MNQVDWDKVPADENGNKAIGVDDAPLAFVVDCGGLGRVEAEEYREAETTIRDNRGDDSPTIDQVLQQVQLNRLSPTFPYEVGIWSLFLDGDDGITNLGVGDRELLIVGNVLVPSTMISANIRKFATQLMELADKAQAAGF
jgi:hypothetical protein